MQCVGCLSVRSGAGDAPELLALDAERRVQCCQHAVVVPELRDGALLLIEVRLELIKLCAQSQTVKLITGGRIFVS